MSIGLHGACYNCNRTTTSVYDHPVPNEAKITCPNCTPHALQQKEREKKLDKLFKAQKRQEFWKSVKDFIFLS